MENTAYGNLGERDWTLLIDAIRAGRVVPILGEKVFYIKDGENRAPVKEYLLTELSGKFCPDGRIAEDLAEIEDGIDDYNYLNRKKCSPTNIYIEINQALKNAEICCDDGVFNMVKTCMFPLILTTAYLPCIDRLLGIESDMVSIYKKSSSPDIDLYSLDGNSPYLFYLFGKSSNLARTFMATEDDFLDYLHSWHNIETRPKILSRYLSDKYLLVLGSEYPDWLFRFFWHSIKNFNIVPSRIEETQGLVTLDSSAEDPHLKRFISHVQAQAYHDTGKFVAELGCKLEEYSKDFNPADEAAGEGPSDDIDVFISYAKEDTKAAESIAELFREKGATVWFDKRELEGGDEYDRRIAKGISHCKRFVPVLSRTTLKGERRYFRKEWSLALNELPYRLHMDYIIPIQIDPDLDIDSELLPEEFKARHFENFNAPDFEEKVKLHVRKLRG